MSFDAAGNEAEPSSVEGPAVIFVAPVTDALKSVREGVVSGSIDREEVGRAVAFSVSRDLLEQLDEKALEASGLIAAIRVLGADWVIVPQDDPLRPFNAQ